MPKEIDTIIRSYGRAQSICNAENLHCSKSKKRWDHMMEDQNVTQAELDRENEQELGQAIALFCMMNYVPFGKE